MRQRSRTKYVTASLLTVALLIIAGYIFWQVRGRVGHSTQPAVATTPSSSINYNPPTTAQKNPAGINNKDSQPTQSSPKATSTSKPSNASKQSVTVLITTWAQKHGDMAINGYVDGVVENTGTCTLTLQKDGVTKIASRPGHANATNTTCGENDIPVTSLSAGTWQATLSYSSLTASGTSDPQPVEVTK